MGYYAACCCSNDPPGGCYCGDKAYACVSVSLGRLYVYPMAASTACDTLCYRNKFSMIHDRRQSYVEAKVWMKCSSANVEYAYNSGHLGATERKFDPNSFVALHTENYLNVEYKTKLALSNGCNPPLDLCTFGAPFGQGTPGDYVDRTTINKSLLPYDVENVEWPERLHTEAKTKVTSGTYTYVPESFGITLDPNKWYRTTKVDIGFCFTGRTIRRDYNNGTGQDSTTETEGIIGCPFTPGYIRTVTRVSEVGDACDYHAVGSEVVTYMDTNTLLPSTTITGENSWSDPCTGGSQTTDCGATHSWPGGTETGYFSYFSTVNGGLFNLEFTDEQPPTDP